MTNSFMIYDHFDVYDFSVHVMLLYIFDKGCYDCVQMVEGIGQLQKKEF